MIYPEYLEKLINFYKKLPGIGEKSAERLALATLDMDDEDVVEMSKNLILAKQKLVKCEECNNLTDIQPCRICSNKDRNHNLICVIEDYKSVFTFEKSGKFSGVYHVLGGLISPIDEINPEDLNIRSLIDRINDKTNEVIIALNPSVEGEMTSLYIQKLLKDKGVKVSRLSYGIPMGGDIEYLDPLTIMRAIDDRKYLE